jgi:serine phosphatase RsbU (regulator of sigma subunit)
VARVDQRSGVVAELLERLDGTSSDRFVDTVFDVLSDHFDIAGASLYVVDYGENSLRPFRASGTPASRDPRPDMRTSVAGKVLSERSATVEEADDAIVWLPVSQRGEAVGVLGVTMRARADADLLLQVAGGLSVALGAAIVGARRRYDLLEATRGASELTLEAAIQWSVLAPTIHEEPGLEVAARVEPATEYAGDAWDFSLREGALSFALFDAVGHGVKAAILSGLAINSYRWSRRRGEPLEATVQALDRIIAVYGDDEPFVTANVCELDRRSGVLTWVCAGHPAPLVITGGRAEPLLCCERIPPLGLAGEIRVHRQRLVPGSVTVLYSDGVVEATDGTRERYSVPRLEQIAVDRIDRERRLSLVVRDILDDVLAYTGGTLRDDATLFGVRWSPT